jgi:hypothetical protein
MRTKAGKQYSDCISIADYNTVNTTNFTSFSDNIETTRSAN